MYVRGVGNRGLLRERYRKSCFFEVVYRRTDVDGVFHARDMETLEEGPNAEKNKTVGRAKDSAAGAA